MISDLKDKFVGCMVGLAIGEALGRATRSKKRHEIAEQYGVVQDYQPRLNMTDSSTFEAPGLPPGATADRTYVALLYAQSIVRTGGRIEPRDLTPYLLEMLDQKVAEFLDDVTYSALVQLQAGTDYAKNLNKKPDTNGSVTRIAPIGLLHSYGNFEAEKFRFDCERAIRLTQNTSLALASSVVAAAGVRLLCRQEILPEDLMAATLDMTPPGYLELPLAGNPLRQKLLAAQDYLEERQTLVDNVEAGNLEVDFFRIDLNNLTRCGLNNLAYETVAAAFYAFAARKFSFEEAVILAVNAGGETCAIGAVTGALAGAYHGLESIPTRWRTGLLDYAKIETAACELYEVACQREENV